MPGRSTGAPRGNQYHDLRGRMAMSRRWYAVQCKAGEDARAQAHLSRQGYEVFRPRLRCRRRRGGRMTTVEESLFPRYLFVNLDDGGEDWAPIRSTRGVLGLVRFGGRATAVPPAVIESIRKRLDAHSGCVDLTADDGLKPHQPVTVSEGPFRGLEGLFLARSGEERVVILLNVMQREQKLVLPETAVHPVG